MHGDSFSLSPFGLVLIMLLLPSCEKKDLLRAEIEAERQKVEENQKMMDAIDQRLRVADELAATQRQGSSREFREKLEAADKQLRELNGELKDLSSKVAAGEKKQAEMEAEIATHAKDAAKP